MPKKVATQQPPFKKPLDSKKLSFTKQKIELVILIVLVLLVIAAQVSGLYPYIYNYAKCHDAPLEVRGPYYRTSYDNGYGIHAGSDYSHCYMNDLEGLQRDPSTKVGAAILKRETDKTDFSSSVVGYTVYVPKGYTIKDLYKYGSDDVQTSYNVSSNGIDFTVRVMKKDSAFSYANLCSKPAEVNWSGTIIGKDNKGREICKTNISKYVKDYIVGMNIEHTAIMIQTTNKSRVPEESLNTEAAAIFSSMEPYSR